jgi:hypothetical protein
LIWLSLHYLAKSTYIFYSPVTFSFLHPSIIIITVFLKTVLQIYFLRMRNQIPHVYKATEDTIIMYIKFFIFVRGSL